MESLFLKIFDMSITASCIVLAVILLRLILKKAPKYIICLLWVFVGLRLVLPFSFESGLSLVPQMNRNDYTLSVLSAPDGYYDSVDSEDREPVTIDPDLIFTAQAQGVQRTSSDFYDAFISVASVVWVTGCAVMLIYAFVSWLKLRRPLPNRFA